MPSGRARPVSRLTRTAKARPNAGTIGAVGSYAERAVLIPVGAALIARDKLAAGVSDLPRDPATANAKAAAQLRKFERRGTSARNGLEREARRTRVRLERELRKRRGDLDRTVSDLDKRRNSLTGKVQDRLPGVRRTAPPERPISPAPWIGERRDAGRSTRPIPPAGGSRTLSSL